MAVTDTPDPLRAVPELDGEDLARTRDSQPRVASFLRELGQDPPQVLLLEGGREMERILLALYWAARLNCLADGGAKQASLLAPSAPSTEAPCLACERCKQIVQGAHRDLFFLDGRDQSIKIDEIRQIRGVLGEAPRGDGFRVVILAEAQALTIQAANSLLKSLEEPRPGTSFVLLTPQRERLLPTLVSRSWVLTLAWPDHHQSSPDEELGEWLEALAGFMDTGSGWMVRTEKRGAVNKRLAMDVCLALERDLVSVLSRSRHGRLSHRLANLSDKHLRAAGLAVDQTKQALDAQVNPVLALDWLATRFFLISR